MDLRDITPTVFERFISKVKIIDDCWIWQSTVNSKGYPQFKLKTNRQVMAHRLSYIWFIGELDPKLTIDHVKEKCSSKLCVNPDHLEQVTRRENSFRQAGSTEEACKLGHLRSVYEKTYQGRNKKYCSACKSYQNKKV